MKRAVYTGSFDPVTNGHMDIIRRASEIFDVLIVSVLNNKEKTPLFSVEERVKILEEATKDLPNVQIDSFSGLLVDYAREKDLHVIVRGLCAITDFEYELQMAQTNRMLSHGKIDTVFLFLKTMETFSQQNTDNAISICKSDDDIDNKYSEIVYSTCENMKKGSEDIMGDMSLVFINKYIERIGDHCTNIAEWVIYMKTGEHPDLNE